MCVGMSNCAVAAPAGHKTEERFLRFLKARCGKVVRLLEVLDTVSTDEGKKTFRKYYPWDKELEKTCEEAWKCWRRRADDCCHVFWSAFLRGTLAVLELDVREHGLRLLALTLQSIK